MLSQDEMEKYCADHGIAFNRVLVRGSGLLIVHPADPGYARARLRVMDVTQLPGAYKPLLDDRGLFVGLKRE